MAPTICGGSKATDGLVLGASPNGTGFMTFPACYWLFLEVLVAWKVGTLAVLSGPCQCQHGLEQSLCLLAPSLPGPC